MPKPKNPDAVIATITIDGASVTVFTTGTKPAPSSKLATYTLDYGDGSMVVAGPGVPPDPIPAYAYAAAGDYRIVLQVWDRNGRTDRDSRLISVTMPVPPDPQPPDPVPTPRGPQPGVSAPAGSIEIPAGSTTSSRQALIDASPTGAVFYLRAGVHVATGSNAPKSGQRFVGECGAILDGTGWSSTDLDDAFFRAVDTGVTGVTIANLEMCHGPSYGVNAWKNSEAWTIEHCHIHHNRNGLTVSRYSAVRHNIITYNVGNPTDASPALRGGGYGCDGAEQLQFVNNEVGFNGPEQKALSGLPAIDGYVNRRLYVADNWFHHNAGNGWWIDGDGEGSIIERNVCEDNGTAYPAAGIVLEKAYRVVVRDNVVRRSSSGIYVSESRECEVVGNTLIDNDLALDVFVDCGDIGTTIPAMTWTIDLIDCVWRGNVATVPTGASMFAAVLSVSGPCGAAYWSNAKRNVFDVNTWTVPNPAGNYWLWNGSKTFAQWQAIPQDVDGVVVGV